MIVELLNMKSFFLLLFLLISFSLFAQSDTIFKPRNKSEDQRWSAHFQFTAVSQSHSSFTSPYSGINSLYNGVERGLLTITSTAFIGRKLWRYTNVFANPEISGGQGLSGARGIAGFTNGESFRIGSPQPKLYMARYYVQQTIPLSKQSFDTVEEDANQLKDILPASRIVITAGKFAVSDFFDNNSVSHDPRTAFLNWSLMSNGAYDYPANTRGYTLGLMAEIVNPNWAARVSVAQVPKYINGPYLNEKIKDANGISAELEKNFSLGNDKIGKIRILGFRNMVNAPHYKQAAEELKTGDSKALGVINGTDYNTKYHSVKYGVGINGELALSKSIGVFFRGGYNDGKTATWAFTEIDETVSGGVQITGNAWKRSGDAFGVAVVIDGISKDHQDFLKAGGYGFIIGDGKLNYGSENIAEIYYSAKLFNHFFLSADYQFVVHPAYNKDRGPVTVFALRGHVNF